MTENGLGRCKKKRMRFVRPEDTKGWAVVPLIASEGKKYIHNHGFATWPNMRACPFGDFDERPS